ncbi:hypothetical protein V6N13_118489 [Hibiscus sabdariffa]|uniref:Peptidase M16 N-terminal domain-containing protein n=1 Tax=Hibiscus sabdariffa TaxID=183260 RepID=A0ABR2BS03_9ROSI
MFADGSGLKYSSDSLVIKSANDRRLYRVIHLHNGLVALLVHDPQIYPDGLPQASHLLHKTETEDDDDEDEDEDDEEDEGEADDEKQIEEKAAQSKKAAAAMCVGFGSFSDPPEAQGLAHFLGSVTFSSIHFPFCSTALISALPNIRQVSLFLRRTYAVHGEY